MQLNATIVMLEFDIWKKLQAYTIDLPSSKKFYKNNKRFKS